MALKASTGHAQALNGREAGLQATHQALNRLGSGSPTFGFVIASHQYQAREVVSGVSSLLGDTPMIGFSSSVCLAGDGVHPNSVLVGLLAGDLEAETRWMPGYAQSGRETAAQLSNQIADQTDTRGLFFFADGLTEMRISFAVPCRPDLSRWLAVFPREIYIPAIPTRSPARKMERGRWL